MIFPSTQRYKVNLALRACVVSLFPADIQRRVQSLIKGEHGGRHDRGYQLLTSLADDSWKEFGYATSSMFATSSEYIRVRHSIVMDAHDQGFQLGWSLFGLPQVISGNSLLIYLVLMTLSDDEAEDQGAFPIKTSESEPADHHFICTTRDPFTSASLEVSCCVPPSEEYANTFNYNWEPLARISLNNSDGYEGQNGVVSELGIVDYTFQPPTKKHTRLRFCHSLTRSELELDLSHLDLASSHKSTEEDDLHHSKPKSLIYDQDDRYLEDEDQHENEDYEEDGFVVNDDDSDDESSAQFSDDDDDDHYCIICRDGGDLMVCHAESSGNETLGCGKSFHAACVGRDEIPQGDWICTDCAKKQGELALLAVMTGGKEAQNYGYEFPSTETTGKPKQGFLQDSSSDEEELSLSPKPKTLLSKRPKTGASSDEDDDGKFPANDSNKKPTKKRRVIEDDSDSD
jgi:hypothetical protein